mmetsp:Transcript_1506/g.2658  ORF Transcript_1506/g.2658 Transcript_1506/m.2658 type:complete len:221 (+) Transcript_1506:929-1591(+)
MRVLDEVGVLLVVVLLDLLGDEVVLLLRLGRGLLEDGGDDDVLGLVDLVVVVEAGLTAPEGGLALVLLVDVGGVVVQILLDELHHAVALDGLAEAVLEDVVDLVGDVHGVHLGLGDLGEVERVAHLVLHLLVDAGEHVLHVHDGAVQLQTLALHRVELVVAGERRLLELLLLRLRHALELLLVRLLRLVEVVLLGGLELLGLELPHRLLRVRDLVAGRRH